MPRALETAFADARYALRGLHRNPALSLTAIVTIALGIGATSAVFSAVDRVLFRPLPYPAEDRLVSAGMMTPLDTNEFLFADPYFDLRRNPGPFQEVTAFQAGTIDIDLTEADPVRLGALRVEANFLHVFGIQPLVGRTFTREEDRPNATPAAMISYGLWRSRFAADPRAVGRTILLDGEPARIVGVLPKNFLMPTLASADLLLPLALNEATEHSGRALRVFARLKPGIPMGAAVAAIQPWFRRGLETVPPQFRKEISLRVRPVRDRQLGDARAASIALFGSVLAVLLIACVNIASLLMARAAARERERAMRMALGASRWRLLRQALTESLILGGMGAVPGCILAWALVRLFVVMAPTALPRLEEAALDARMLLFTIGIATACGLLFGIAPALDRSRSALTAGWHSTRRVRGGLRWALVSLEIAFSMVLLTGASLLLRSLWNLERAPLGMETSRVLAARFVLGRQHYGRPEQQLAFFNELEQRLAAAPGVDCAAITDSIPPSGGMRGRPLASMQVEGQPRRPQGTGGMVAWRYVTPKYFRVLGIPVVRGRPFTQQDRDPAANVAILSQSLAQRMFPNADPIGKRILIGGPQGVEQQIPWTTVIGIARDVTNLGARRESWPEYYIVRKPSGGLDFQNQEPPTGWRSAVVIAHTPLAPALAAGALRAVLRSLDPTLPVEIETMEQRLRMVDARPRAYAVLLAVFASIGLFLAAIGLFGVLSFLVAQRTREIGVRIALGATPAGIMRLMVRSAAGWTALGVVAGTGASLEAARLLAALLFQVEPGDPGAIAAAIGTLCAAALAAALAPAHRAARLDPARTLRQE
jgi:putative ABC transport system permease protein